MATGIQSNTKTFTIIWLDSEANASEDNLFTQQKLFNSFDNVEIYENEDECEQWIQSKPNKFFLIILSGRLSQKVIPNLHDVKQVSGFYVYCFNKSRYEEWSKQYPKINAIITDLNELLSQIRSDLKVLSRNNKSEVSTAATAAPPRSVAHGHSSHSTSASSVAKDGPPRELEDKLATASVNSMICPFNGYEKVSIVSLEESIAPLVNIVDKVEQMAWIVKQNCENPTGGLTIDESASIALYTMDWYTKELTFNYILNETLRSNNKEQIRPWFSYLKLLIKALSKLPSISRVIYQGTNTNLSDEYPNGKVFDKWDFSTCASCIKALEDEEDFGRGGQRTLFTIECCSGKAIGKHAHDPSKEQVLLLPGRKFQVISCLNAGNDLTIVQIQELESSYKFK